MKRLFQICTLVYLVLPGWQERGHKTLKRCTVCQDFGGEQEKFSLINCSLLVSFVQWTQEP